MIWLSKYYKVLIAVFSAVVTFIISPAIFWVWTFVVTTNQTNATIKIHESKIESLENTTYRIDERFKFIQRSLEIIQDRELKALKDAQKSRSK